MGGCIKEKDSDRASIQKIQEVIISKFHSGNNDEIVNFIFNTLPIGVILLNRKIDIIYNNKQASLFLSRFELPEEIPSVSSRIFHALDRSRFQELFPGEISIVKKLGDSPSNWIFRFSVRQGSPVIVLFIVEDKVSNKVNVNEIRQQHRLTRRETDVVRRVLDGLRNSEIAKELEIQEQTVKDHLSNVYAKIGTGNRFELVRSLLSTVPLNDQFVPGPKQ